jgi:HEAT repeat protein
VERPTLPADPDALQELVGDPDQLRAEAALAALVRLAPKDLDRRLAELFRTLPDARKEMGDGPIHRQLLFALSHLDTPVATEAIGRAVFFPGESDAVPPAISRWAAEMYWERAGKQGREVWVEALDSETPHVLDQGLYHLGLIGDPEDVPRLGEFERPAAYEARIRLGDDSAYPDLVAGLSTPDRYDSYSRLRALGPRVEPHVLPFLEGDDPVLTHFVGILLSRVGTEKSVEPLSRAVERYPAAARLRQALEDLKKRLAE